MQVQRAYLCVGDWVGLGRCCNSGGSCDDVRAVQPSDAADSYSGGRVGGHGAGHPAGAHLHARYAPIAFDVRSFRWYARAVVVGAMAAGLIEPRCGFEF